MLEYLHFLASDFENLMEAVEVMLVLKRGESQPPCFLPEFSLKWGCKKKRTYTNPIEKILEKLIADIEASEGVRHGREMRRTRSKFPRLMNIENIETEDVEDDAAAATAAAAAATTTTEEGLQTNENISQESIAGAEQQPSSVAGDGTVVVSREARQPDMENAGGLDFDLNVNPSPDPEEENIGDNQPTDLHDQGVKKISSQESPSPQSVLRSINKKDDQIVPSDRSP